MPEQPQGRFSLIQTYFKDKRLPCVYAVLRFHMAIVVSVRLSINASPWKEKILNLELALKGSDASDGSALLVHENHLY